MHNAFFAKTLAKQNPKSESRNLKQTQKKISNRENPKHRIRKKLVLKFYLLGHLKLFRISHFVLRIFVLVLCGFARDTAIRSLLHAKISKNIFARFLHFLAFS